MTKNEKERLKHRFDESKKIDKINNVETDDKKYKKNVKKAVIITCVVIAIVAIVATVIDPELIARLNMFKNHTEPIIEEYTPPVDIPIEDTSNTYYVQYDVYYAYAFDSDFLKGDKLDGANGYFPYSTPEIKNGVLDCYNNLTYYFTNSLESKTNIRAILNPEVKEPSLYLILKVSGENLTGVSERNEGMISLITLYNRNTNDMITYVPEPSLKFIYN